jgi:hypothetical protein
MQARDLCTNVRVDCSFFFFANFECACLTERMENKENIPATSVSSIACETKFSKDWKE